MVDTNNERWFLRVVRGIFFIKGGKDKQASLQILGLPGKKDLGTRAHLRKPESGNQATRNPSNIERVEKPIT